MKKFILQIIVLSGLAFTFTFTFALTAAAQHSHEFDLKSDEPVTKEITLEGVNVSEELKLSLKVEWKKFDNRLHLTFDRKTVSENDAFLLFFPLLAKPVTMKDVVDCKLEKKFLWSKNLNAKATNMNYFLHSDNLVIENPTQCYKSLANNNEEEFDYQIKEEEIDYTVELKELYVAVTQKRPWYTFSSRNKKVLFRISPTTLLIRPEKKPVAATVKCEMANVVVPYIEAHRTELKTNIEALLDAQKKQSCTVFGLLMDKIRRTFVELNDKCERYSTSCEEIAAAIKSYNDECENIMKETCKATAVQQQSSACSMSENELTSVNAMLRNIQMKINVKKKEGQSIAAESREFQNIKSSITPKLTAECRRTYKSLIDAYTNYCTVIDGLLK